MLKLKKIAITGGLASGKSTVCQFFQELGACVVSADAIVHEILASQADLGQKILRALGSRILQDGKIDRKKIAEIVFHDAEKLRALEEILHPAVLKKIASLYEEACREKRYTSFVVEMPLLFEIGAGTFYDVVITVIASESLAKARFQKAGHTEEDYKQRMSRQLAPTSKAERAHYTILNNSSLANLRQEVEQLNTLIGVSLP